MPNCIIATLVVLLMPLSLTAAPRPPDALMPLECAAWVSEDRVTVAWLTAPAPHRLGFRLYRSLGQDAGFAPLHDSMLPALFDEPGGERYGYADSAAAASGTLYRLDVIDVWAGVHRGTPFGLTARPAWSTELVGTRDPAGTFRARPRVEARTPAAAGVTEVASGSVLPGPPGLGSRLKIRVRETGLYRVTQGQIATGLGMTEAEALGLIAAGRLRLHSEGRRAAWFPSPEGDGIDFFSSAIRDLYTLHNIFWLERGRGLTVPPAPGSMPSGLAPAGQTFRDTVRVEQNERVTPSLFNDPDSDCWLWFYLYGGTRSADMAFDLPGIIPSGAQAEITVRVVGASETDHRASIVVNGATVGAVEWSGRAECEETLTCSANLLRETNTLAVENTAGDTSLFFLDWIDVTYDHGYCAEAGALLMRPAPHALITVTGFSGPAIRGFEVTDASLPVPVEAWRVDDLGPQGYAYTFEPWSADAAYFAVGEDGILAPDVLASDTPSTLRSRHNGADMLIVTDEPFVNALSALSAHRRAQGLSVQFVDIDDVYDEFSWGRTSPHAIRRLLAHACDEWEQCPAYVLLGGHGSIDPKNYKGFNDDIIPVMFVPTPYGLCGLRGRYGDNGREDPGLRERTSRAMDDQDRLGGRQS